MLFLWFIYIIGEAFTQGYYFREEESYKPDYRILWLFRITSSILHAIVLQIKWEFYGWDYPIVVGFQMCTFWILFDPILNKLRGKKLTYRGGSDSSAFDRIAPVPYWIFKSIAFIGIFIFYYLYGQQAG
jgi:hypothetical protein